MAKRIGITVTVHPGGFAEVEGDGYYLPVKNLADLIEIRDAITAALGKALVSTSEAGVIVIPTAGTWSIEWSDGWVARLIEAR